MNSKKVFEEEKTDSNFILKDELSTEEVSSFTDSFDS